MPKGSPKTEKVPTSADVIFTGKTRTIYRHEWWDPDDWDLHFGNNTEKKSSKKSSKK